MTTWWVRNVKDRHHTSFFPFQVKQGLCNAAVKHEDENRYCNLFPFDNSRVVLTGLASGDYINANWVSLAGVPEHKFILTMAPLHPDSKAEHLCDP